MHHVGLKIGLLGTSSSMVTLIKKIFLDVNQSGPRWVQRPITCFKGARDDFMVHSCKQPLRVEAPINDHLKHFPPREV